MVQDQPKLESLNTACPLRKENLLLTRANPQTGAKNLLRGIQIDQADFPADPEQLYLTSWGEWWAKDVYALSLDRQLQDQWCPSKEDIEKEIDAVDT